VLDFIIMNVIRFLVRCGMNTLIIFLSGGVGPR